MILFYLWKVYVSFVLVDSSLGIFKPDGMKRNVSISDECSMEKSAVHSLLKTRLLWAFSLCPANENQCNVFNGEIPA